MLSNSKNKKILDVVPEQMTGVFGLDLIRSEQFPYVPNCHE